MPSWAPEAFQSGLVLGALLGLVLYNSAVLAEIMRAGILSLPRGQGEAASALGMTYRQSLRYVILPQGLRRMVPATVSQLITLNKDTTLVSIIAITEVMRRARIVTVVELLHRRRGADPARLHLRRLPVRDRQLRAVAAVAAARAARAQDHGHEDEARARARGPGRRRPGLGDDPPGWGTASIEGGGSGAPAGSGSPSSRARRGSRARSRVKGHRQLRAWYRHPRPPRACVIGFREQRDRSRGGAELEFLTGNR